MARGIGRAGGMAPAMFRNCQSRSFQKKSTNVLPLWLNAMTWGRGVIGGGFVGHMSDW